MVRVHVRPFRNLIPLNVLPATIGQFFDFLHLLKLTGPPSETNLLLFNGDFVDRGSWSTEVALTLFAYKCECCLRQLLCTGLMCIHVSLFRVTPEEIDPESREPRDV